MHDDVRAREYSPDGKILSVFDQRGIFNKDGRLNKIQSETMEAAIAKGNFIVYARHDINIPKFSETETKLRLDINIAEFFSRWCEENRDRMLNVVDSHYLPIDAVYQFIKELEKQK